MTITAAPGIYLVKEIKEESAINLGTPKDRKILKGIIISVGENRDHDSGGKMVATYVEGDIIRFLNYEESYDWFEEGGQKIHCVLFNDCRAKVEE